ncbi:hypothetical protein FKP32DRAFT_1599009 [Trametes sanguinea]|nr:hypothetical protein FKP32DRAFT_1599009 [Trametes sanguinea]
MYDNEDTQDDLLSAYFEKSATAVRHSFGRFEQGLLRPTVRYILESFEKHPLRSTFLATYATLSALPVLSFIGLSIFIFSSFIFFALSGAVLAAFCVVLFCGFWLTCIILFLFIISIPIATGVLLTFLLLRLAFVAKQEGAVRPALSRWMQETKSQFVTSQPSEEKANGDAHRDNEAETLVVGTVVLDEATPVGEKKQEDASVP